MSRLEEILQDLADSCSPPREPVAAAVRGGRTLRRRHVLAAALSATVLVVGGAATVLAVRHAGSGQRVDNSVAGPAASSAWPARGNLATNSNVSRAVARAWDGGGTSHQAISVLYAGEHAGGDWVAPIVVVAAARDASGQERIGWFTSSDRSFDARTALATRADTAAPSLTQVHDLGVVVKLSDAWMALELAAPGYTVAVASVQGEDLPPGVTDPEGEFVQRTLAGSQTQVVVKRNGQAVSTHTLG